MTWVMCHSASATGGRQLAGVCSTAPLLQKPKAAVEAYWLAYYYRAYLADILFGYADWKPVDHYGESDIKIVLLTDCKSLSDNLKKDGSVPDDKWIAVPVAALRGAISAGPERNRS